MPPASKGLDGTARLREGSRTPPSLSLTVRLLSALLASSSPGRAGAHLDAVQRLLDRSHALRTPSVGSVDSSGGRDCATLVNTVAGPPYMRLTDGSLFGAAVAEVGGAAPFLCVRGTTHSASGGRPISTVRWLSVTSGWLWSRPPAPAGIAALAVRRAG
jgi:hypothetical protein